MAQRVPKLPTRPKHGCFPHHGYSQRFLTTTTMPSVLCTAQRDGRPPTTLNLGRLMHPGSSQRSRCLMMLFCIFFTKYSYVGCNAPRRFVVGRLWRPCAAGGCTHVVPRAEGPPRRLRRTKTVRRRWVFYDRRRNALQCRGDSSGVRRSRHGAVLRSGHI